MNSDSTLWLHSYSGRENGLMIVGDRAAFAGLARQLADPVPSGPSMPRGWPQRVAAPRVVGPDKGVEFKLTFHLQGDLPNEKVLPLHNKWWWRTPVLLAIIVCAITGAMTIVQWIASSVL